MSIIVKSIVEKYHLLHGDGQLAGKFASILDVNEKLAEILTKYHELSIENIEDFIYPKLKNLLPDPQVLLNMDIASKHIINAIEQKKKIGILGDYDVDGVCSASIMKIFLKWLGIEAEIIIPDRFKDGYGPSNGLFDKLSAKNVNLVITLDCGTVAFEPIEYAKKLGIEVIVTDHHISKEKKPDAIAIINPNQIGDNSNLGHLCAAGVAFLLCFQVLKDLKSDKNFKIEINLLNLTHFVAMATICDMMKLIGVNRAFYATGIDVLNFALKNRNSIKNEEKVAFIGISALCDALNLRKINFSSDIGFKIGPVLNAAGRLKSAMTAVELLTQENEGKALNLAYELITLNSQRREIQDKIFNDTIAKSEQLQGKSVIFVASSEYNEGVIGIVAARIKDLYGKTAIVGSIRHEESGNIIKISARAAKYANIGEVVMQALDEKLILKGGGHTAAAGFTCKEEDFDEIYNFFEGKISDQLKNKDCIDIPSIYAVVDIWEFEQIYKDISKFEPFGTSFNRPNIVISGANIFDMKQMSEKYAKITLKSRDKVENRYKYLECIYFGKITEYKIKSSENLLF